jgi:hypothetical protein
MDAHDAQDRSMRPTGLDVFLMIVAGLLAVTDITLLYMLFGK